MKTTPLVLRSQKQIVEDISRKYLDFVFGDAKYEKYLEDMLTGDIWDEWVDVQVRKLSRMTEKGHSKESMQYAILKATHAFALNYIGGRLGIEELENESPSSL